MGKSHVASVHATWRRLGFRARLLLDHMVLQTIDADDPPIYVGGWKERAAFLGYPLDTKRAAKSAWEKQRTAVRELEEAGVIIPGQATQNDTDRAPRPAWIIDVLGTRWSKESLDGRSKEILDTYPGRSWTWSKSTLGPVQGILGTRSEEEPQEPLQGTTTDPPQPPHDPRGPGREQFDIERHRRSS